MKILFTFPGQGTQHEGMLQNLPGTELEQARAVLGAEVDTLDSACSLTHTRAVQLSLLIAGVAWARELERRGVSPDIVSGLSIGAYRRRAGLYGRAEAGGVARRSDGAGVSSRLRPDGNYGVDPAAGGKPDSGDRNLYC